MARTRSPPRRSGPRTPSTSSTGSHAPPTSATRSTWSCSTTPIRNSSRGRATPGSASASTSWAARPARPSAPGSSTPGWRSSRCSGRSRPGSCSATLRILVTGGAGFIGSNVADRFLELGHEVAIFDDLSTGFREFVNPRAKFHEGDLADAAAIDRCIADFRPEIVDHHAAQIDVRKSVSDPLRDARVNILGSIALLQSCTHHGVRKVIYASTGGALYGEGRELPATEDHPVNPESPYGTSKHTVEHYLYLWKLLHGLDYTVLRYPNVYGPRQNPHGEAGVNAIFIGLMLEGRRPRIFGSGEQLRDYLYVGDVVAANLAALERGSGAMVNLGTGIGTSVN